MSRTLAAPSVLAASNVFSSSSLLSSSRPLSASTLPVSSSTSLDDFEWDAEDAPLGEGRYGEVFKARRRADSAVVAVKRVRIFDMDDRSRALCLREAELLLRIHHCHIIQVLDVFLHHNELFLVMEYADIGDMARLISGMRLKALRFTEEDVWRVVYCIASGLQHMHAHHMMHRDIKPANVYLSRNGDVKVGDLGLGRVLEGGHEQAASVVGTPYYMSPELISGEPYSFKTDVWSLGCLVYEMAMLKVPFDGRSDKQHPARSQCRQRSLGTAPTLTLPLCSVCCSNLLTLGHKILECQYTPVDDLYSREVSLKTRRRLTVSLALLLLTPLCRSRCASCS